MIIMPSLILTPAIVITGKEMKMEGTLEGEVVDSVLLHRLLHTTSLRTIVHHQPKSSPSMEYSCNDHSPHVLILFLKR